MVDSLRLNGRVAAVVAVTVVVDVRYGVVVARVTRPSSAVPTVVKPPE